MKSTTKSRKKKVSSLSARKSKRRAKTRAAFLAAGPASGQDALRRLARTYHLSAEDLSRVTGAAPRTVSYWNAGQEPQRSSTQKLKEVVRLFDALSDIIKAKAITPWLQRPNKQLDGSTPLQVMERGEGDRIWRMIWQLREGHAG